jgi:hypothetical protein
MPASWGAERPMKTFALVTGLAIAAALTIGGWVGGRDFVVQHWAPLAVAALLAVGLGTVALRLVAGVVRGAVLAVRRPRALGQSGAAAAEFVIVVIPFMLMLTALMQLSLASMARVLVSYSAFCAARAAAVFVPMDSSEVQGVGAQTGQSSSQEQANSVGNGANTRNDFSLSKKASLMRNAAAYPLMAASPSIDVIVADIAQNWAAYLENRLLHGLNPVDFLKSMLGDSTNVPPGLLDNLGDQIKDAVKGGLDTPQQKQAAKDKIDAWIAGAAQGNSTLQDQLKNAVNSYIDSYKGSAGSPTGQIGDLVQNTLNSTLSGPLDKFKDSISQSISNALGGLGGKSAGYAVDRALDVGFGSSTDGAGGAILRSLRKLVYARLATVVTLLDEKGNYKTKFEWNEPIRARVTYLFYCQIPLANRFAGRAFYDLPDSTVADLGTGPMKGFEVIGIPGYFMAITADHVMVNQGKPL